MTQDQKKHKIENKVTIIPLSQTQICWNKSKYSERTDTYDPVTNQLLKIGTIKFKAFKIYH